MYPTTFDLIVGSQDGIGDIVEQFGITSDSYTKTSVLTDNIQEISISLTAVYNIGMKSRHLTNLHS